MQVPPSEARGLGSKRVTLQVTEVRQEEINPPEHFDKILSSAGAPSWIKETEDQVSFWTEDLVLDFDLVHHKGQLRIANWLGWHNALRFIYFYTYLNRQGLLLHAAGLLNLGRALVFPGPSGAGKTTIVRNSPGKTVLSDEVVAIQLSPQGEAPLAYGTPFIGDWGGSGAEESAPLRGFFFPVKSQENRLASLTPSQTLRRLLPCIITYTTFVPRQRQLFELAERLAQSAPGFLLHFRANREFWNVLDGY